MSEQADPGRDPRLDIAGELEELVSGDPERRSRALGCLQRLPPEADPVLRAAADDPRRSTEQRLAAIYLLLHRGAARPEDLAYARSERVVLPGPVPEEVREAILRSTGTAGMQEGTDIRWYAEAAVLGAFDSTWEEDGPVPGMVPALRAALAREGVESEPPVPYHRTIRWEWDSNYLVMRAGGHVLRLSLVGPFVSVQGEAPEHFVSRCRRAAESAGWLHLGPEVLEVPMSGLLYDGWLLEGELTVGEHLYYLWGGSGPGTPAPPP